MRIALLSLCATAALAGCRKHDPDPMPPAQAGQGIVRLVVDPLWNGAPFDKTVIYTNAAGHRVLVQGIQFYLGNMRLVAGGSEHLLKDIDLFNVTDDPQVRHLPMDTGAYDQVRFGIGVPYDLNHTDPATFDFNHPLGAGSGMYWTWTSLYRFVVFDGRFDTVPGAGTPPYLFSIHTGFDTLYREVELPLPMEVESDDTVDVTIGVDLARFFQSANDTLYLNQGSQWHGEADQLGIGIQFSDLVSGAFSVQ